eukprot:COSAG03_NODE_1599_length_3807_cov_7.276699_2_plen_55_part_00
MRDFEVPNLSVGVIGCVPARMVHMSTVAVVQIAGHAASTSNTAEVQKNSVKTHL